MKTRNFKIPLITLATVASFVLLAGDTVAQDATVASQPTAASQSVPRLAYSTAQIQTMLQAKVGESTILAYIQNSSMTFPLDAAQIIYLKQQGASNAILDAMLNHQSVVSAPAPQASTATAQTSTAVVAQDSTAVAQPTVTYVQSAAPSPVYVAPSPYYYPYYGYYPYYSPVTVSLGFGYYGGGYYGGWHGGGWYGGGWHGGGWHGGGWHGGGWHGGGGGWHR
jgi:uncharacterized membrane protein YgcG